MAVAGTAVAVVEGAVPMMKWATNEGRSLVLDDEQVARAMIAMPRALMELEGEVEEQGLEALEASEGEEGAPPH